MYGIKNPEEDVQILMKKTRNHLDAHNIPLKFPKQKQTKREIKEVFASQ